MFLKNIIVNDVEKIKNLYDYYENIENNYLLFSSQENFSKIIDDFPELIIDKVYSYILEYENEEIALDYLFKITDFEGQVAYCSGKKIYIKGLEKIVENFLTILYDDETKIKLIDTGDEVKNIE